MLSVVNAEFHFLFTIMLKAIMLSVIILNVVMLSILMLSVVAPQIENVRNKLECLSLPNLSCLV